MITNVTTTAYQQLQDLDKQIAEADSHLRIVKSAGLPGALQLESDLAKAKASRKNLMEAIETEHNRS
jgi:hypothetical protein